VDAATTISGSTFSVDTGGTAVAIDANTTLKDSIITGSSGTGVNVGAAATSTSTIKDNTFDTLGTAIMVSANTPILTITGNTIQNCSDATATMAAIDIDSAGANCIIADNDINSNECALDVSANVANVYAVFNSLVGNTGYATGAAAGQVIRNSVGAAPNLLATNNWWGDAAGPATGAVSTFVTAAPYLRGATSMGCVVIGAGALTAKTTLGVNVTEMTGNNPDVIGAASYAENPGTTAVPGTVLAYSDVLVLDTTPAAAPNLQIRLYGAVTANSQAYAWSDSQASWVLCSNQAVDLFDGCVVVTCGATTIPSFASLAALPFALTEVTPPPPAAPTITSPLPGATGIALKPTFSWGAVAGTLTYQIQVSTNASFSGAATETIPSNAYAVMTDLDYSTTYYWRVRATTATQDGPWTVGIFTTMAEPEVPKEEWISPYTGQKFDSEAELLAHIAAWEAAHEEPEPTTPAYIWAIIAIGAVLVVVVIVLIVRTRRAV
jgi:hypothetical protein